MNEIKKGYVPNEVYKVEQFGNTFKLIDTAGVKVGTLGATTGVRKGAFKEGKAVQAFIDKNGKKMYRKVSMDVYNALVIPMNPIMVGFSLKIKVTTLLLKILSTKVLSD